MPQNLPTPGIERRRSQQQVARRGRAGRAASGDLRDWPRSCTTHPRKLAGTLGGCRKTPAPGSLSSAVGRSGGGDEAEFGRGGQELVLRQYTDRVAVAAGPVEGNL